MDLTSILDFNSACVGPVELGFLSAALLSPNVSLCEMKFISLKRYRDSFANIFLREVDLFIPSPLGGH